MGEAVFIYGASGSGKTRSLKNFGADKVYINNTIAKRFPFQNVFKYVTTFDDVISIENGLSKMPTKAAIIDDAGYLMTSAFMNGHGKKDQYALFNFIGDMMWELMNFIKNKLPDDVIVYLIMHEDRNDLGDVKLRTIGKLLDQKVCLEGMATVVLHCMIKGSKHIFLTNSGEKDIAKSPEGMFETEIENDLKFVDDRIREYWGI